MVLACGSVLYHRTMADFNPRNYSNLFNLFAADKPDKVGIILETIGKIGFTASLFASLALAFIQPHDRAGNSLASTMGFWIFGGGFFAGVFFFIATGIHYSGLEKGETNFLASTGRMLKNTFLYLLLPVMVITALLLLWAYITKQPAFR